MPQWDSNPMHRQFCWAKAAQKSFLFVLSRYFFCMMFAYVLHPFREFSMSLCKHYQFKIYLSVIWKTLLIVIVATLHTMIRRSQLLAALSSFLFPSWFTIVILSTINKSHFYSLSAIWWCYLASLYVSVHISFSVCY